MDKAATAAGGKTILELEFNRIGSGTFPAYEEPAVLIKNYYTKITHYEPYTRIAYVCDEKDNYRFGFNGMEKDNEAKGIGNSLDFGARIYDSRLGRWLSVDPKSALLPGSTTYSYGLNSPIRVLDADGEFPILVNGKVGKNSERASSTYWSSSIRSTIKSRTGYEYNQFKYVDGDQGFWPGTRLKAGKAKGVADANEVYAILKKSIKNGKITEQIQVISHSRGGAFANGYMQGLTSEVIKLAEKDEIGFSYGKENLVEYSVNLAPHQSNFIHYPDNGIKNINISHVGDPLSGNDATGNVINVHSIPEKDAFDQHGNATYNTELDATLETVESNTDKETLKEEIKDDYEKYDNSRTNGGTSTVK